ncbi:MAG: glycosyltransferase family 2 protein [Acidimicrobiales bacterium]
MSASLKRVLSRAGQTLTSLLIARNSGIPLYKEIPRKIHRKVLRILRRQNGPLRSRSYPAWIAKFDSMDDDSRARLARHLDAVFPPSCAAAPPTQASSAAALPVPSSSAAGKPSLGPPVISIIMPVYNTPEPYLRRAVDSVTDQVYKHWELCIADDASSDGHIRKILEEYSAGDERIKLCFRSENGHISAASNSALSLATGDYIALLDHDDELAPYALAAVALEIHDHPDAVLIYSDEDKIDDKGNRNGAYFKSDFDPELILSQNYLNHLGVFKKDTVQAIGGFQEGFEGSQDWDLALRVIEASSPSQIRHIPRVLYHWRSHPLSAAGNSNAKPYAAGAAKRAVEAHLERSGLKAEVIPLPQVLAQRVRYELPDPHPLVSIVIPTRDGKLLQGCIKSLTERTSYSPFEVIIVDNGSVQPHTLAYLSSLEKQGALGAEAGAQGIQAYAARCTGIQVLHLDIPFNYSTLNNAGASKTNGELICLLNDDIEVIDPEWLTEMVRHAVRPEVGAVGAKLLYPNGTIQHGGVILGLSGGGGAHHASRYVPAYSSGYFGRAALTQSFSAVTGACLLVRRALYEAIGGLDEEHLPVTFNDVDICLRLKEAGYRTVWEPAAVLAHHESTSRGRDDNPRKAARVAKEVAWIQQQWGTLILNDTAYNPNLSLETADFDLAWPPRIPALWGR